MYRVIHSNAPKKEKNKLILNKTIQYSHKDESNYLKTNLSCIFIIVLNLNCFSQLLHCLRNYIKYNMVTAIYSICRAIFVVSVVPIANIGVMFNSAPKVNCSKANFRLVDKQDAFRTARCSLNIDLIYLL